MWINELDKIIVSSVISWRGCGGRLVIWIWIFLVVMWCCSCVYIKLKSGAEINGERTAFSQPDCITLHLSPLFFPVASALICDTSVKRVALCYRRMCVFTFRVRIVKV